MYENSDTPYRCSITRKHCEALRELDDLRIEVEQLNKLVAHDPLTGLFNYRHFSQTLPGILEGVQRSHRPACLIMLDLDHFKQVNDTWGHEAGNLTLRQTARVMGAQIRKLDQAFRYGGEEFAIVLPDTELRQAAEVAERLREHIAQAEVVTESGTFHVTASLGIEVSSAREPLGPETLIRAADSWLYKAKEGGRNRVAHRELTEVEAVTGVTEDERDALRALFDDDGTQSASDG